MVVSQQHLQQFEKEGYFILEDVLPQETLEGLRRECDRYVRLKNEEMDAKGVDTVGISHRNNRYFVNNQHGDSEFLKDFLFGPLMAEITGSILGHDVYLFLELFVVKCAEVGMPFGWHQDSGYMQGNRHKPYLTCWSALDDMDESNGTLWLLPYSQSGVREVLEHHRDPSSNDLIGYNGTLEGVPVVVPAGSMAIFSSLLLHRSGVNRSSRPRRVYLAEYSSEPIQADDGKLWSLAVPFLKGGEKVAVAPH